MYIKSLNLDLTSRYGNFQYKVGEKYIEKEIERYKEFVKDWDIIDNTHEV